MSQPLFSLGLIADCQYADVEDERTEDPPGSGQIAHRAYRKSLTKLTEAVGVINGSGAAALIHLGDLVDRNLADAAAVQAILDTSTAPVRHIAGNHDFTGESPDSRDVFTALGMAEPYYSMSLPGFRLVFLNSNELGVIGQVPGTPGHAAGERHIDSVRDAGRPNAFPWNGAVGRHQLDWLRAELEAAAAAEEKVALFVHHPFYPDHAHNMLNDLEFRELVSSSPRVVAAFSGHNHWGNFGVLDGIGCVTIHGMVERDDNAYALAHFHEDRIELQGFGRQPSLGFGLRTGRLHAASR